MVLSWTDASGGKETGFQVFRRSSLGEEQVYTAAANATTFTDSTAAAGERYTYRVYSVAGTRISSTAPEITVGPL